MAEELEIVCTAPTITANFDVLEAQVRTLVSDYEGATYDLTDPKAIKEAKAARAYLNGIAKRIDERRKEVKREYTKPLSDFEARCKEVSSIALTAADGIKAQLDVAEDERRANRYADLSRHYEDFAGLLAPVVPYERLHEDRWLNKTVSPVQAEAELDEKVEKLANDWEALKGVFTDTELLSVAERSLFTTLDLSGAISCARMAEEETRRIAELKSAMEPEPEPVEDEPIETVAHWVIELDATRSQVEAVATQLKAIGLTGTIHKRRN